MFSEINHIAIICSDYERSKKFYCDTLGFEIVHEQYRKERDSHKLDLKMGDIAIELFSFPDSPKRLSHPEAVGLRHLALETNTFDITCDTLKGRGVSMEEVRQDSVTGKRLVFFHDPDELPIEICER